MRPSVPRWCVVSVVVVVVLLVAGWLLARSLVTAIDHGKLKRDLADTHSLVMALEEYRSDHGSYPAGFGREIYQQAIEPDYMRKSPSGSISYYSDGRNYALIVRPFTPASAVGATPRDWTNPIEVFNGRFVTWPEPLTKYVESYEGNFVGLYNRDVSEVGMAADGKD